MTGTSTRARTPAHRRRCATLALVALVAGLGAALAVPGAAGARVPRDFYGVVTQSWLGPQDARMMKRTGVDTLRFHLDWRSVQGEPGRCKAGPQVGVCDWRQLDYGIGLLASRGIRSFPFLLNVPWFIDQDSNVPPIRSRFHRKLWTFYVKALVKRYGQGGRYWKRYFPSQFPGSKPVPVTHWEIWNEPSDGSYWEPKPDPREYGKLLKLTGRAIHDANPKADVVFAGLFGTPNPDDNGIKAFKFYRRAFATKGLRRHVDDIGVHPYGPTLKRLKTQMAWLMEEMRRANLRKRDVWVTEIAWSSSPPPGVLAVGREAQARLLRKAFKLFLKRRGKWNVSGVHWYAWQDLPRPALCEFCYEAGLVEDDRDPKPSYFAFRRLAR